MMPAWPLDLLLSAPCYSAVRTPLRQLGWQRFPELADWATIPDSLRPRSARGQSIHFVAPSQLEEQAYELRIGDSGQVATRPDNWHDCFNALCWLAWPQAKAALNRLHLRELAQQPDRQRSRARDAATLFDESGLVLVCSDPQLHTALLDHDWPTLFQTRRAAWGTQLQAWAFGHALLEKGLAPYLGLVAKLIVIEPSPDWPAKSADQQQAWLDGELARRIDAGLLSDPRQLPPLPVLGIPGWWPVQDAAFYADQQHFRPRTRVIHPG